MRGCFVGSGSEGLQQPEVSRTDETVLSLTHHWPPHQVVATILRLTEKEPAAVTVLYIGTATYDLDAPKHNQTRLLAEAGCTITQLKVVSLPRLPRAPFPPWGGDR